ncbi:MAG: Coenzyme F420 hydrogenase/dehydrogenase, beta subunit C-terminal domain, partial [Promethearchaeota archaeon]
DFFDSSEKKVIRDLFILKDQGYIKENVEEITENRLIYKYQIKDIDDSFKENYFKSISIVRDNNLCCECGLCSSVCPVDCINLIKNDLFIDEVNCITCGLCFSVCPKSFSFENIQKFIKKSDPSIKYSNGLGYYKNINSARTLKYAIRKVGQDGGIVTSILYYLLNRKLVDAVITIKHSETYWEPKVSIIEKLNDLHKIAGSTYVHAQMLSILDRTRKYNRIAIVALPCKINALSKGELFPVKLPLLNNIKYKIGLFCKVSFPYENLISLFSKKFSVNLDEIVKMDVNQGNFVLTIESGEIFSIPLKECDLYCSDFCNYCNDFTAELADISIGAIGSELGWSSIIIRTKKGEEIFNGAIKDGLIEVKNITDKRPLQVKIKNQAKIKRDSSRPIEFEIAC